MFGRKSLSIALLVALLTVGPGVLRAGDDVPFKGDAVSVFKYGDLSTLTSYFEITEGNLTHLGAVTGTAEVHWTLVSLDPLVLEPAGADITLVAADGDELYLEHDAGEWDPDTATSTADFVITGGTGRFEGATGGGTATASGSGTVSNSWTGTIDYKKN